jgi:hypothetical protein
MKTLSFPGKRVKDVNGLYYDLLEHHFEAENVAVGGDCTYVYLHDAEDKDPAALVDVWIEKLPPDSKSAIAEREKMALRVTAAANEERAAKVAARAAMAAQDTAAPAPLPQDLPVLAGSKQTLFSKIFRKLW